MIEQYGLFIAFITGLGLGTIFFFGLWKTVKEITTSKSPSFWLVLSPISRISITMLGFYLIATLDQYERISRILLCLLGFLIARFIITKVIRCTTIKADHAS